MAATDFRQRRVLHEARSHRQPHAKRRDQERDIRQVPGELKRPEEENDVARKGGRPGLSRNTLSTRPSTTDERKRKPSTRSCTRRPRSRHSQAKRRSSLQANQAQATGSRSLWTPTTDLPLRAGYTSSSSTK